MDCPNSGNYFLSGEVVKSVMYVHDFCDGKMGPTITSTPRKSPIRLTR